MKKFLALVIVLLLTMSVICVPCPVAMASTNPNDFIGTWYPLNELEDGTLVNMEGYYKRWTLVLNADYTVHVYDDDWEEAGITDWGTGGNHGTPVGMIWILLGGGYMPYKLVDGCLISYYVESEIYSKDILPAGGRFLTDAALEDFDGSWVFSYAVANGMRMSIQEFYASRFGFILQMGEGFVMNELTIDNGRVTDTGSERGQTFEFDHSFGRLTAKFDNDNEHTFQNLLVFTLHESGLIRYTFLGSTIYYQRADAPDPTPEPEPSPEPTPEPSEEPELSPEPEDTPLSEDAPEPTPEPEETPLPEDMPIPTPANNDGGNSGPGWLIIALIALAVVAVGVIVTSIIVWKKKA